MRTLILTIIAVLALNFQGQAKINFPVEFRVEKQAMSTPMTDIEDILFVRSYYSRPLNIKFDGKLLAMVYDNGEVFTKKELTQVDHDVEYEDNAVSMETFCYTDNENGTDAILFVIDYSVGYVQVILTTKNSSGENVGFTSYRQFISQEELALN